MIKKPFERFNGGTNRLEGTFFLVICGHAVLVCLRLAVFTGSLAALGVGGFDLVAQGMSGLMSITGAGEGGPPMKCGPPVLSSRTSLYGRSAPEKQRRRNKLRRFMPSFENFFQRSSPVMSPNRCEFSTVAA